TQLLVYVGGTLVLVVFGVMLTAQGPFVNLKISAVEWLASLAAGLVLYGVLVVSLLTMKAPGEPPPSGGGEQAASNEVQLLPSPQIAQVLLGITEATPEKKLTGVGFVVQSVDPEKGQNGTSTVRYGNRDQPFSLDSDAVVSVGKVTELKDIKAGTRVLLRL